LPLGTSRAVASVLAGAAAFALVAFATRPPGPGLDPDAASYVGAAVSFVRTGAFRIPTSGWAAIDTTEALAHFPPGFPVAIAGPIAVGASPVQSARVVMAVSAFVTATVTCLLMDTTALGFVAVAVIFLTPAVVDAHLSVLSEPLFLALLVAALALFARGDWKSRLALGLVGAAAVMVRYAGVGLVGAAALWVLARRGVSWRQRLRDLALVSLPAVIALRIWTSRNAEIRRIASYGHFGATLRVGANTVADWLAPGITAPAVRWAVAAVIAAIAIVTVVRAWRSRPIIWAAALIGASLAAITVVSRLRADPNIPFDERIFAPGFLLAELATVAALGQAPRIAKFLLGAWVVASAVVSTGAIKNALDDGNDFASSDWRYSPTVAWVRDSASGRTIYTNWPVALYFQAGRSSHSLPPVLEPLTLRRFGDRLVRTHGLMVAFDIPSPDAAPPDSIAERLRLARVARLDDGTVWELANPGDATRPAGSGSP
jgi:hypothetical protein